MDDRATPNLPTLQDNRYTIWITSLDNIDHVVTDQENTTAAAESRGTRRAVCGVEFFTALLETPPGWTCQHCLRICRTQARAERIQKVSQGNTERRRLTRRRRLITWLLRRQLP